MNSIKFVALYMLILSIVLTENEGLCAEWQRQIITPKGNSINASVAQPLTYFTSDPFMRDDGNDFCVSCTSADKATIHLKRKFKTKVSLVGKLQGFNIYDVYYWFDRDAISWKFILVETEPGQFREIYHLQPTDAEIKPSFIFNAGGEMILGTRDLIPGTGAFYYEEYWWFDQAGVTRVDTSPLEWAIKSILPEGGGIWKGYGLDMRSLNYRMDVWKKDDGNCCPTGGSLNIKFKIVQGHIIVTEKHFIPPDKEVK